MIFDILLGSFDEKLSERSSFTGDCALLGNNIIRLQADAPFLPGKAVELEAAKQRTAFLQLWDRA